MEKIKDFFLKIWEYIKTRNIGFFFLIPAVILSFVIPFVYLGGFGSTPYYSALAFALPFIVIALFALAFFKPTARYAPIAMFVMTALCLVAFINATYMHLADTFYSGITDNVFVQAGAPFSFIAVSFVLNLVFCAAAAFMKQYAKGKDNADLSAKEATV